MAINTVNSAGIADGSIVNADVKSDAAIAGSKLADESITLAKLEHGDGSSNGKYLRSNNGGDPSWETVSQYSTPLTTRGDILFSCLLYTSPSPRDRTRSRMPSSA